MPTCPQGHDSASTDFCDVCGMRIGGAAPAPAGSPASGGPQAAGAPAVAADPCPQCGAARTGQFCETCGYNFASGTAPQPAPGGTLSGAPPDAGAPDGAALGSGVPGGAPDGAAPDGAAGPATPGAVGVTADAAAAGGAGTAGAAMGAVGGPGDASLAAGVGPAAGAGVAPGADATSAPAAAGWSAVVTADRAYFDSVIAAGGPDAASLEFPGYCPERRFRLTGREMRIGRRSVSRGLEPEIDLSGPPADPGVSHMHAVLMAEPDGSWVVLDPGSSNGTIVNGAEIAAGVRVPLHDGDRVCVGAWTVLTIQSPPG